MYCQVCGARNEDDAEYCQRCRQKLMVLSGSAVSGEETLDAAFDLTAAVMAGVAQSMNQRYKASRAQGAS